MDKERKALLTQELDKAEASVLNSIRNSDSFVRVRTIYATLGKGEPDIYIGVDPAISEAVVIDLRRELRTTKTALTKALRKTTKKK